MKASFLAWLADLSGMPPGEITELVGLSLDGLFDELDAELGGVSPRPPGPRSEIYPAAPNPMTSPQEAPLDPFEKKSAWNSSFMKNIQMTGRSARRKSGRRFKMAIDALCQVERDVCYVYGLSGVHGLIQFLSGRE